NGEVVGKQRCQLSQPGFKAATSKRAVNEDHCRAAACLVECDCCAVFRRDRLHGNGSFSAFWFKGNSTSVLYHNPFYIKKASKYFKIRLAVGATRPVAPVNSADDDWRPKRIRVKL